MQTRVKMRHGIEPGTWHSVGLTCAPVTRMLPLRLRLTLSPKPADSHGTAWCLDGLTDDGTRSWFICGCGVCRCTCAALMRLNWHKAHVLTWDIGNVDGVLAGAMTRCIGAVLLLALGLAEELAAGMPVQSVRAGPAAPHICTSDIACPI